MPGSSARWSTCITSPTSSKTHLAKRQRPRIVIADEREKLLGTGAGVVAALPELGDRPFFHVNSDTIWIDGVKPNLARLADAFDPARMDALLLLAPTASSIGYSGRGGFLHGAGRPLAAPRRAGSRSLRVCRNGLVRARSCSPARLPANFPLTLLFDRAAEAGRLHGLRLEGVWMHIGTPEAVAEAEEAIVASAI